MSRGRGRGNSDGASANPSAVRRPEPAQNGHLQVNHILLSIIYRAICVHLWWIKLTVEQIVNMTLFWFAHDFATFTVLKQIMFEVKWSFPR